MTNDQIQKLFEKKIKKLDSKSKICFFDWVESGVCLKEEMDIFAEWLNQISEELLLSYIEKDGTVLSVITNQTESLCKESILKSSWNIFKIRNVSKELYEIAIDRDPMVFLAIQNQTVDLCLFFLKRSPNAFSFINIVESPDYETTLKNLLEKKAILEALK